MRFLIKRPNMNLMEEELNTVMEVMASDIFIYIDLFVFSLIFTLLLSPAIHSLSLSSLFFIICYGLFSFLYYFLFRRRVKRD